MILPERIAGETEHSQQAAIFCWAALNIKQYPQLKWLFAVPNGFFSSPGQKAKMKAEGLKDGVPDVVLPWPNFTYGDRGASGLYIEMKREKYRNAKDGGCSLEQLEWLDYLNEAGYKAVVCYNWEEARDVIKEYLNVT